MPYIQIDVPPMSVEKKAELVQHLTEVASRIVGVPEKVITIQIRESPPENVGVGGKLLSELRASK